jgi:phosphoribosylaminoimidazolecarboxamide formyltransferase/IMP cyclohydrolase
MSQLRTALISVHDKTGLVDFARGLLGAGFEILSTGGTLAALRDAGIRAISVAEYTGQPEILGGRVKTLHPRIFAGILARRDNPGDLETLRNEQIRPIDVVAVTLYPFEDTIRRPGVTLPEAIEQIDIGGVSLLRAAAKNSDSVWVLSDPSQYDECLGGVTDANEVRCRRLRRNFAIEALRVTSRYDAAISTYLAGDCETTERPASKPATAAPPIPTGFRHLQALRYGENSHQSADFYALENHPEASVATARQLHGKELSYNNILDLDAALEVVKALRESSAVCIVKHNNPCGVARHATSQAIAFRNARDCDPVSAFGGIMAVNRPLETATAEAIGDLFLEAIIAPGFEPGALDILRRKKNLRLLETGPLGEPLQQAMLRSVVGGLLVQSRDLGVVTRSDLRIVTKVQPTEDDLDGLLFAWRVAKFVKSNAIVYTSRDATIGIGAGQMSRIDSTNIGAVKAQSPVRGAYMASDAFFPFRDNVDRAADIGVKAIICPGGSVRDEEVIAAADEHGIAMVFTGMRHFRH